MKFEFTLQQQIQLLDEKSLAELRLFVEFLLSKQQKPKLSNKTQKPKRRKVLADMERIPVPVDNIIIDRAEIYADRS